MFAATGAYAQFANSESTSSKNNDYGNYSKISVSYLPSKLKVDGGDSFKFQGFSLGWVEGINVAKEIPLFVEAGAALQFRTYSDELLDDYDYGYNSYSISEKINVLSLNIPVNLLYKLYVTKDFSIEPMFGIDFRINLTRKYKLTADDGTNSESESVNIFSDDMEDVLGEAGGRFQAGWHIGANLSYKKVTLGVNYGQDFNEIFEECKVATTTVSLGYSF